MLMQTAVNHQMTLSV